MTFSLSLRELSYVNVTFGASISAHVIPLSQRQASFATVPGEIAVQTACDNIFKALRGMTPESTHLSVVFRKPCPMMVDTARQDDRKNTMFGDCAFCSDVPAAWNKLLAKIKLYQLSNRSKVN